MKDATQAETMSTLRRMVRDGVSMEAIAARLGVCSRTVRNWHDDKNKPRVRDRNAIRELAVEMRSITK